MIVRPSTLGSRPNRRSQPRSLSTTTGCGAARSSSAGINVRPIAGRTPITWKAVPLTSVIDIMRPSTRVSMSDNSANMPANTLVSRPIASNCGRVKRGHSSLASRARSTANIS